MALTTYHVSASQHSAKSGLLVDHGINGGIVGEDCCIIEETTHFVDIEGIDNHVMKKRPMGLVHLKK